MDGKIVITGDSASLVSAMQKASEAVRGFQSQAEGSFGRVQAQIGQMQAKWVAMGSFVLGGAGFREAVDATVSLTKEATALGKTLGISATQASILNVALGDIYQSKDTLITASSRLTKTLKDDEDAFTRLGVRTRDQNGQFRSSLDIMLDVNKRLLDFKEGTDRNIEGMKIYGKSWGEVAGLLKLNRDLMEESKKKAEALNLVVGQESVEAVARYRASMNDVGDVLTAVKKSIGDAVMPALTELGNEFANSGPEKVERMRQALSLLVVGFYGLKNGLEIAWEFVKAFIQRVTVGFLTMADVAGRALEFDFTGAKRAFAGGWQQLEEIGEASRKAILDGNLKNSEAMRAAFARGFGPVKTTPTASSKDGDTSNGGTKAAADSRVKLWEAELAEKKQIEMEKAVAEGHFYEMSKEEEQRFWQDKLRLTEAGTKEQAGVRKRLAEVGLSILREQYDAEQASLKLGMEAAKDAYAAREIYMQKYVDNVKDKHKENSKAYREALQEQEAMRREHEQKLREMDSIRLEDQRRQAESVIDENMRIAQMEYDLGLMTREQLLQVQQRYIEERMRLDLEAADNEIRLYHEGTVEYEQALARRNEIRRRYEARLSENKKDQTVEKNRPQLNVFDSAQSSLEQAMTSMLTRSQSWAQAMKSLYQSVGTAFIEEMVTKPFAKEAVAWARRLAQNLGFLNAENAQQAIAAATSVDITTTKAGIEIGADAAAAGAGAAKSVADIPVIGPGLALAAMAAVFAAVSGMSRNVKSAAGGFDIPRGMNPMTQLHEEEMVIPAKYANGLRNLINGGGAGQGSGGDTFHYNDYSGRLSEAEIVRNAATFAKVLKKQLRNGAIG